MKRILFLGLVAVVTMASAANAQNRPSPTGLKVFLDCERQCDRNFIRTDIPIVDWVNDRQDSDVHLLVIGERTGSGGRSYSLNFIGRGAFAAMADTLQFASSPTDTDDNVRRGLSDTIKLGLVRYLARTSLARRLSVGMQSVTTAERVLEERDPWDYWIFSVSARGEFRGESATDRADLRGDISANRTTEAWKIRLSVQGTRDESNFNYETDEGADTTVTSVRRESEARMNVIKSLTGHWSVGIFSEANNSSRRNTKAAFEIGPSIEYNIFPYSQSTERELRLQYHLRVKGARYDELTILERNQEAFLTQTLEARLDLRQPWGNARVGAEFLHFLTNFEESRTEYYNLQLQADLEIRLIRGLSLTVDGRYSFINDQVYLPLQSASGEDVLLGSISLPTSFEYSFKVGFSYRFGSIYNNVVNPRFGGF